MRNTARGGGVVLWAAVLSAGCFDVSSLHPLIDDDVAVAVPAAVGTWTDADGGSTVLTLRALGGAAYELTVTEDGAREGPAVNVRFGRLGEEVYWDLTAPVSGEEGLSGDHRLPVHSFARVRLDDDRLELAFLDPDGLEKAREGGRLEAAHAVVGHRLLLTAATDELRRLIIEHGGDEGLFTPAAVFRRSTE